MIYPQVVSFEHLLGPIKALLRIGDTTEHDPLLRQLIDEGAGEINDARSYIIKNCKVEAQDNYIDVPADGDRIVAFRGATGCANGIFLDLPFFQSCNCMPSTWYPSIYTALNYKDNRYYFVQDILDGTEFEIAYTAANRDDQGRRIITQITQSAVKFYVMWMFADSFFDRYPERQIERWKSRWETQAGKVRSLVARDIFEKQRVQIRSKMNAILTFEEPFNWMVGLWPTTFWYTNSITG